MAGNPVITEILASNNTAVRDEDGAYSDYIEIYNSGDAAVDLNGYFLSDDPSNIRKWAFPATQLDPGGFLVVWASSKNRRDPAAPLHTNFNLSADGEFLALSRPAPTEEDPNRVEIVSGFQPEFPRQQTDASYGVTQTVAQSVLTSRDANARAFFPRNDALGSSWTSSGFSDGAWTRTTASVGFQQKVSGFTVQDSKTSSPVTSLAAARSLIAGSGVISTTTRVTNVVNFRDYEDGGASANFANDLKFPNDTSADDNFFAIYATGTITIPSSGVWTIGTNSDDGVQVVVDGVPIITDDSLHAPEDRFGSRLLTAGEHSIELYFFENGGGAEVELFAAPGQFSLFNNNFRLIGDVAGGGLKVETVPGGGAGGFSQYFGTNVQASMLNQTRHAYLRIPFQVADPAAVQDLTLRTRYDDGFIGYLNGVEVVRRNATGQGFNATAGDRSEASAVLADNVSMAAFKHLLVPGQNLLAIQAINDSDASDEFLFSAELVDQSVQLGELRYFAQTTPGDFNPNTGLLGFLDAPIEFSVPHGIYDEPFQLALASSNPNATIRYTTNGAAPDETTGQVYSGPITIDKTTVVRVQAFQSGYDPTAPRAATYLFLNDVIRQSPNGTPPAGFPASNNVNGQILNYGMDPQIVDSTVWGPQVVDALKAIPSMSLVMDMEDLFDPGTGIYTHAFGRGQAWERPGSLELLNPDGTQGFQVNAGVRIRGGYSRTGDNPKHAFRFFFRGEYGDSKLRYPLFEDEGATEFDAMDLRTTQNYSWSFGGDGANTFLRDVFARDVQREMGQPYTRSRYYHLYLNGQYWGLFQTQERAESDFGATYFGGEPEDYDVIKSGGSENGYFNEVNDGNDAGYRRLADYFYQPGGLSDTRMADYWKAQGMNPDGTRNLAFERLLDVDNLIDYMLSTYYGGDRDGPVSRFVGERVNNYFAIFNRVKPDGFKFFEHDSEHSLDRGFDNLPQQITSSGAQFNLFNPLWMHEQLIASNAEYRVRFSDRVHQHFYNGGPLSDSGALALINERAQQIEKAIIAESARWGDSKREPAFTKNDWQGAVNGIRNWINGRANFQIDQFQRLRWLPRTASPEFLVNNIRKHGGQLEATDLLSFSESGGLVEDELSPLRAQWKYWDSGTLPSAGWFASTYDDSAWKSGVAELGYGDGDEATVVSFGGNAGNKHITTYFRREFNVDQVSQYLGMVFRLRRDDGAVIYVNGRPVATSNMPEGTIDNSTRALINQGGSDESNLFRIQIESSLLRRGKNVIAVEVHQADPASSDLSFDLSLSALRLGDSTVTSPLYYTLDGSDPRLPGGTIAPQAIQWDRQPISLSRSARINVRKLDAGQWSGLTAADFRLGIPASAQNLRISELHFHPAEPNLAAGELNVDKNDFEFIELMNTSTDSIDLTGLRFRDLVINSQSQGIDFDFAPQLLAPGARIIVVRNQAAMRSRYGDDLPFALGTSAAGNGVYNGRLDNGGETLSLFDAAGEIIQQFTYDDWYAAADGGGFSMEVVNLQGNYGAATNWKVSTIRHGTPGSVFLPLVPGDITGDRKVDIADFVILRRNFGGTGLTRSQGDLSGDGRVDISDFVELRNNFGRSGAMAPPPAEPLIVSAAVPAPSAAALSAPLTDAQSAAAFQAAWEQLEQTGQRTRRGGRGQKA